jgi:hypothetical protein
MPKSFLNPCIECKSPATYFRYCETCETCTQPDDCLLCKKPLSGKLKLLKLVHRECIAQHGHGRAANAKLSRNRPCIKCKALTYFRYCESCTQYDGCLLCNRSISKQHKISRSVHPKCLDHYGWCRTCTTQYTGGLEHAECKHWNGTCWVCGYETKDGATLHISCMLSARYIDQDYFEHMPSMDCGENKCYTIPESEICFCLHDDISEFPGDPGRIAAPHVPIIQSIAEIVIRIIINFPNALQQMILMYIPQDQDNWIGDVTLFGRELLALTQDSHDENEDLYDRFDYQELESRYDDDRSVSRYDDDWLGSRYDD